MIDFFNNLPDTQEKKKLRGHNIKMSDLHISKSDISELKNNISGRMKITLPQSPKAESLIIPEKEKTETQRTRRGEQTSLF